MIYIDPPYGVKFGSNFQPFVRKRDVSAADDGQSNPCSVNSREAFPSVQSLKRPW
jgi:hypothetical protein